MLRQKLTVSCHAMSQQVNCILPTGTQELGAMCQLVPRCCHGGQWGPERGPLALAAQIWRDNRGLQRYLSHSSFCCFLFSCLSILVHLTSSWATMKWSSDGYAPNLSLNMHDLQGCHWQICAGIP